MSETREFPETGTATPPRALRSIRSKLVGMAVALVVGPGLVYGLIAEQNVRSSLERAIGVQLAREAGHTRERLAATIATERAALASFAQQDLMRELRVGDIDKRISSALTTLREGSPHRLAYAVLDAAGEVVASSEAGLLGDPPPWLAATADSTLEPVPTRVAGFPGPVLLEATAVPDPDGALGTRPIGTLVGILDWERLTEVAEDARRVLADLGHDTRVILLREGEILGGAGVDPLARAFVAERWPRIAASVPVDGHATIPEAGFLVGSAALERGVPGERLLFIEALEGAMAPVRSLRRRLALGLGAVLVAGVLLATVAAHRIIDPLVHLTGALRRVSLTGAPAQRVPVRGRDEIAELGQAFNRMAADLDQAHRDVVEAAKYAFVGELAAGVAHEVRTALGVLRSSSQLLERSLPEDAGPDLRELAAMMLEEVARLNGIVDDLLGLARPRVLDARSTPLREPLERALSFVEPQARELGVTIDADGVGAEIAHCDPELTYRAALNLLVNALQVVDGGGRVAVRTRTLEDDFVAFEVDDDGPGVPAEIETTVFSPFVTAREGGVGLGLAVVQRMALEQGGRVSLERGSLGGACFRVALPGTEASR